VSGFNKELRERLRVLQTQGLHRELREVISPQGARIEVGGRTLLNFSSNDYLGLANEPALKEAAFQAIERFGAGSGASRLICGSLAPHHELEETLAAFKGTEAALSFSSGYAAALGTICALLDKDDVIVIDKLVHACLVDAARLCGARLRVFAHNDLNDLEDILRWAAEAKGQKSKVQGAKAQVLVVTESVFSMAGDQAPLPELVELKDRYGAWLMVDEAHATGLYGAQRRGLAEALGLSERIEIQMGTLGKALGAAGGFIAGSRALIDYLVNRARSFIFSTAPAPAAAAAASAGVRFVQSEAGAARCAHLWERVRQGRAGLQPAQPEAPSETGGCGGKGTFAKSLAVRDRLEAFPTFSAILPVIVGDEARAVAVAARLREEGLFIPAIRYPTVARGQARLRVTLTAAHTEREVNELLDALRKIRPSGESPPQPRDFDAEL
jgi:8-amino-7-oxononanoate synthase